MSALSKEQIERFSRQLLVRGWGMKAQERLMNCSVYVSPALTESIRYLKAAGARLVAESELSEQTASYALLSELDEAFPFPSECQVFVCTREGEVIHQNDSRTYAPIPPSLRSKDRKPDTSVSPLPSQLFCALLLMKQFSSLPTTSKPSLVLPYCRHGKE